jgi:DnaJ-class molecular chaperone
MLGSLLSEEEAKKLKEVFYVLCRRLHPDLNPQQTTQEADLFIKVKAAYDLQQLDELQRILLYLDMRESSDFTSQVADEKQQRIEHLEKSIAGLKEKMAQLESAFPFTMRALLGDEAALAEKKAEIQSFIQSQEEEIVKQQTILDIIVHE